MPVTGVKVRGVPLAGLPLRLVVVAAMTGRPSCSQPAVRPRGIWRPAGSRCGV
jgi:hypothetical protein